jgi:hypothetical protein
MGWEQELEQIVQAGTLVPTFEEWLAATGNSTFARAALTGNVYMQARAMNALYEYYQSEMRKRFS